MSVVLCLVCRRGGSEKLHFLLRQPQLLHLHLFNPQHLPSIALTRNSHVIPETLTSLPNMSPTTAMSVMASSFITIPRSAPPRSYYSAHKRWEG